MRHGELWFVVGKGDYAEKPRPYLIIQRTDMIAPDGSITMMPITSVLTDSNLIRARIHPNERNGLQKVSDIMVDKVQSMKAIRLKQKIGEVEPEVMEAVFQRLRFWLDM